MDTDSEMSDVPAADRAVGTRYAQILRELGADEGTFVSLMEQRYTPRFRTYKRRRLRRLRQNWVATHGTCGRCADDCGEVIYELGFPAHRFRGLGPWDPCDICPWTDLSFTRFDDPEEWDGSPLDPTTDELVQLCLCCSYRYIPFPEKQKIA